MRKIIRMLGDFLIILGMIGIIAMLIGLFWYPPGIMQMFGLVGLLIARTGLILTGVKSMNPPSKKESVIK